MYTTEWYRKNYVNILTCLIDDELGLVLESGFDIADNAGELPAGAYPVCDCCREELQSFLNMINWI